MHDCAKLCLSNINSYFVNSFNFMLMTAYDVYTYLILLRTDIASLPRYSKVYIEILLQPKANFV
jgi:hypothetical protein